MKLAADYEKDEVTLTLSGLEANDLVTGLTVAVSAFKRGEGPTNKAMAKRVSVLQSALWDDLNVFLPTKAK